MKKRIDNFKNFSPKNESSSEERINNDIMKQVNHSNTSSDEWYKSNCKECVLVFSKKEDVASMDDVNKNWNKYKNIEHNMISRINTLDINDDISLGNILIKILDIDGNAVHVKMFGKTEPRFFSKQKKITDINLLTDSFEGYIDIMDFNKYIKKFDIVATVMPIIQQLIKIAKKIKHDDDYGILYYNDKLNEVWWVASDGDGYDGKTDDLDVIAAKFMAVKGISNVTVEAEAFPDEADDNWKEIEY